MLSLLQHRFTRRVIGTLLFELLILYCAFAGLLFWRGYSDPGAIGPMVFVFALCCTAVIQLGLWSFGLYSRRVVYSGRRVFQNLLGAFFLLSGLLFPVVYLFSMIDSPVFRLTLRFYVVLLAAFICLVALERFLVLRLFSKGTHLGNVLLLGTGQGTREVIREARRHHGGSIQFAGVLGTEDSEIGSRIEGVPVLGQISEIRDVVREREVRTIVLSMPYDYPDLPLDYLLECRMGGRNVYDASAFYESMTQKILIEKLDPFSVLYPGGYSMTRFKWFLKDASEKVLAVVLLALLALPLAVVWALVRLTSPGPAIYHQERVGQGGQVFTLLKFRTMVADAEKETGATWARRNDPRTTAVGRVLRRLRIDELPQLFNILRGDMAFVGPRPERPEFVEDLVRQIPYYHHRHFVKPGLTGWAQVTYSYAASLDDTREKLRYDLYYIKNMSFFFDLVIMLATARAVVTGNGVR